MINYTPRLDSALRKAAWAHEQHAHRRKGTDIPYIIHPVGVMMIASNATDDEDTLIACLMHDVLEDVANSTYSEVDMRIEFGDRVTDIVKGVTKDTVERNWHKNSELYLSHLRNEASDESVVVSVADKTHNLLSTLSDHEVVGDELWERFSTKSSADQLWWYESILEVAIDRQAPAKLIEDFSKLIKQLRATLGSQ